MRAPPRDYKLHCVQTLREKLIQAGLVKPEAGRQAQNQSATAKETGQPARAAQGPTPGAPPVVPGSKAHQRLLALQQVEVDRKLRELVQRFQVAAEAGEHAFYFATRKKKLRRLEISEAQARLLEQGALAIVERPEPGQIEHSLVPAQAADQMLGISDKSVRFYNRRGAPVGVLPDEQTAGAVESPSGPHGG